MKDRRLMTNSAPRCLVKGLQIPQTSRANQTGWTMQGRSPGVLDFLSAKKIGFIIHVPENAKQHNKITLKSVQLLVSVPFAIRKC